MNYKILQKVLDELGKVPPNLDYIRGMVETLMAFKPEDKPIYTTQDTRFMPAQAVGKIESPKDEGSMLDAIARANLKTVQDLSRKSSE